MWRLVITLDDSLFRQLSALARQQDRKIPNQATYLLRTVLREQRVIDREEVRGDD